jgi:hypothetical protein
MFLPHYSKRLVVLSPAIPHDYHFALERGSKFKNRLLAVTMQKEMGSARASRAANWRPRQLALRVRHYQMVDAVWADEMPSNKFLSASICLYLRFQLHCRVAAGLRPAVAGGILPPPGTNTANSIDCYRRHCAAEAGAVFSAGRDAPALRQARCPPLPQPGILRESA